MTLPLSAAEVLGEHVVFELECIDRVYCNAYVPKLAYPGGVATFFTKHRGATFASTCLADPISKQFVAAIGRFAALREIPIVRFEKGQRKDDVAQEQLARFGEPEGIYMIGVAQEKIRTFRTEKRRNPVTGVAVSVDRGGQRGRQPVLPVRAGCRVRPVLREVLKLLPVRSEAVLQRSSLGAARSAAGGDRVHRAGQRVP